MATYSQDLNWRLKINYDPIIMNGVKFLKFETVKPGVVAAKKSDNGGIKVYPYTVGGDFYQCRTPGLLRDLIGKCSVRLEKDHEHTDELFRIIIGGYAISRREPYLSKYYLCLPKTYVNENFDERIDVCSISFAYNTQLQLDRGDLVFCVCESMHDMIKLEWHGNNFRCRIAKKVNYYSNMFKIDITTYKYYMTYKEEKKWMIIFRKDIDE